LAVDEHGPAPGPASCLHIPPAIAHHEAAAQIEPEITCGIEQKARSRLPAMAPVSIVVKTDVDRGDLHSFAHFPVDFVDYLCPLQPPSHVRLIRDDHQGISGNLQPTK
jgi:hypothetical protein